MSRLYFFFSSRRRHTRWPRDWSSDVCSSDLLPGERVRAVTEAGPPAKFLRARVTEVLEASALRVPDRRLAFAAPGESAQTDVLAAGAPRAEVSGADVTGADALGAGFGGMEYAHVDLAGSRDLKAEVLSDQLARLRHIDRDVEVRPAPGETGGTEIG